MEIMQCRDCSHATKEKFEFMTFYRCAIDNRCGSDCDTCHNGKWALKEPVKKGCGEYGEQSNNH